MSLVDTVKTWFRTTCTVEVPVDSRPYPRVDISVRGILESSVLLAIQVSEERDPWVGWFNSVEEAEAVVSAVTDNMRLAAEATKRIQEKLHGA
jgi:hypothetical protein